ncbi:MAG: peptidylprolyl isomerase, partial [Paracoccaceae bacterium]|nr:peptidylprolyl isomerase [Paracoccaceae bacterium]
VTERGLELSDIDLGDVSVSQLGSAGETVFASDALGVVGPVNVDLGAALFRVNGILAAQSTTFEEALPLLRDELAADRARRVIDAQVSDLEDLLAAGATLEDLAADTEMELAQIGWHSAIFDGIAGYAAFRSEAGVVRLDDFPAIANLGDGGVFALRLDGIDAARPEDFDAVRDQVEQGWAQQKETELLVEKATAFKASLDSGGSFESLGLTANVESGLSLRGRPAGVPADVSVVAFELRDNGEIKVSDTLEGIFVVRLDEIVAADMASEDTQSLIEAIEQQTSSAVDQDVFAAFAEAVRLRTDIEVNQQAVNAVHANFQ